MKKLTSPKIGIVSGVGPLAGSDVLSKVFKNAATMYSAIEDNEYPDVVLINHGIAGVDNTGKLDSTFEKEIVAMVHQLEDQGANVIGIACNTAHVYINSINVSSSTVLVNLIEAVSASAGDEGQKYILLTSSASKQQKLYHDYLSKHSVSYQETSDEQQAMLDETIGLVMSHQLERAGRLFEEVLKSVKKNGINAAIAGCTELPIAAVHCKDRRGVQIIDSNDILAKTLLSNYYSASTTT